MTTVNYTVEENVAKNYVKVEWPAMLNGDDGQPFDCSGLSMESIHIFGAGGTLGLDVSNEISPANFVQLDNYSSGIIPAPMSATKLLKFFGFIRPVATDPTTNLAVAILFRVS